jgi:hypothetical protein
MSHLCLPMLNAASVASSMMFIRIFGKLILPCSGKDFAGVFGANYELPKKWLFPKGKIRSGGFETQFTRF